MSRTHIIWQRCLLAAAISQIAFPQGIREVFAEPRTAWLSRQSRTQQEDNADDGAEKPATLDEAYLLISEGQTDDALAVLDDLLLREPGNPWGLYFKGLALMSSGRPRAALETMDSALDAAVEVQAEPELLSSIRIARAAARRELFSFNLRAGFFHDTNVSFLDDAAAQPGLIAGDEDGYFGLGADFRVALFHLPRTRAWLDFRTGQSWHYDIDSFDYQNYGGSLSIRHNVTDALAIEAGYDYDVDLLGRKMFGSFQRGRLRLDFTPAFPDGPVVPARTSAFYHLESNDFQFETADVFDQDATVHLAGIEQVLRLRPVVESPFFVDLMLGYRYSYHDTDGTEFQRRRHRFQTGLSMPVLNPMGEGEYWLIPSLPMNVELGLDWLLDRYTEDSMIDRDNVRRRDHVLQYRFALSQVLIDDPVDGRLTLRFLFQYFDADSNVITEDRRQPFDYQKGLYGLQLHWSW